jgi:hypothetical protein
MKPIFSTNAPIQVTAPAQSLDTLKLIRCQKPAANGIHTKSWRTDATITVVLNGQTTAKLRNGMFDEGPIALQHAAGAIKFRKVEVKAL